MTTGECYEYDCGSDNDHLTTMFTSESFVSWRRLRRAAHETLTKRALRDYHTIQMKEATILVSSLLTRSDNLKQDRHFKRLAASSIMTIVYDYPTIKSDHDHAVEKIEKYDDRLSHALTTGSYLVDIFPWMVHIPERSWLPFSRFVLLYADGRTKSDSRNGNGKAYEPFQRILRCSEAFLIV